MTQTPVIARDEVPTDHLVIPRGSTYQDAWTFDDAINGGPADWTGCTAFMEFRYTNDGPLLARLTSAGGEITLETEGNLGFVLAESITTSLQARKKGVFDVYVVDADGKPWRVMQGSFVASPRVTVP